MISPQSHELDDDRLNRLFYAYREATEYEKLDADFMPGLWRRIESRRRNSLLVERMARVFATATVALAVVVGLFVSVAGHPGPGAQDDSWVEALANDHLARSASYYEPVRLSTAVYRSSPTSPGQK